MKPHRGKAAVTVGLRLVPRTMSWAGGTERAMIVDGYTWTPVPGTGVEVRALDVKPLALRWATYPQGRGPRA